MLLLASSCCRNQQDMKFSVKLMTLSTASHTFVPLVWHSLPVIAASVALRAKSFFLGVSRRGMVQLTCGEGGVEAMEG